jgi:hypothetical protein
MGQAVQRAPAAATVHYERRRPEGTTLYQLVQEHLDTFLAQVEARTGAALPGFVKDEFDAFLECSVLQAVHPLWVPVRTCTKLAGLKVLVLKRRNWAWQRSALDQVWRQSSATLPVVTRACFSHP